MEERGGSLLRNRSRPYPSSRSQLSELRDGQRTALGSSSHSRTLGLHDAQDVFAAGFADLERLHQLVYQHKPRGIPRLGNIDDADTVRSHGAALLDGARLLKKRPNLL